MPGLRLDVLPGDDVPDVRGEQRGVAIVGHGRRRRTSAAGTQAGCGPTAAPTRPPALPLLSAQRGSWALGRWGLLPMNADMPAGVGQPG